MESFRNCSISEKERCQPVVLVRMWLDISKLLCWNSFSFPSRSFMLFVCVFFFLDLNYKLLPTQKFLFFVSTKKKKKILWVFSLHIFCVNSAVFFALKMSQSNTSVLCGIGPYIRDNWASLHWILDYTLSTCKPNAMIVGFCYCFFFSASILGVI